MQPRRRSLFQSMRAPRRKSRSLGSRLRKVQEEYERDQKKGACKEQAEEDYRHPRVHPINRSWWNPRNFLSYCSFSYITRIMDIGSRRPLQTSDLIDIPPQVCARRDKPAVLARAWITMMSPACLHCTCADLLAACARRIASILCLDVAHAS